MEQEYGKVTPEVLEKIREIAGEKNVIADDEEKLAEYGRDALAMLLGQVYKPEVVVKPETTEQISRIMKLASENMIPVTPRGAGTGLACAAVPLHGGIILSIENMNKVLEIDPIDRVAVVEPGVITNELCKQVLEKGLMYAGYPMSTESSFIGGNVATNAGGGKVIKYGNTRRHIMGLEVVLPDGEILQLGGRFRKSTWGYDLLQLMIGSEGTLGIITKIIVNLVSGGGKIINLLTPFPDLETAVEAISKLIVEGNILPEAVEYMDRLCLTQSAKHHEVNLPFVEDESVGAFLIVQLHGKTQEELEETYEKAGELFLENGAIDVFIAESRQDAENIWKVREEYGPGVALAGQNPFFGGDIIVPFSRIPDMSAELKRLEEKYKTRIPTVAHLADGNFHSAIYRPDDVPLEKWTETAKQIYDEMTATAIRLGGTGGGEHGVGVLKRSIFMHTASQAELNLIQGIKKVFDPKNILNPGKIA